MKSFRRDYIFLIEFRYLTIHGYLYVCAHNKLIFVADQHERSLPRLTTLAVVNGNRNKSLLWASAVTNVMRGYMQFNKVKHKVLHPGGGNSQNQYRLWDEQIETSPEGLGGAGG